MAYISMGKAHRRISEYLFRFHDAVSCQNGASLSRLLNLSANTPYLLSVADGLNVFKDFGGLINRSDDYSQFAASSSKNRPMPFCRSLGIGNPLGRLKHYMWLLMRLEFLLKGLI